MKNINIQDGSLIGKQIPFFDIRNELLKVIEFIPFATLENDRLISVSNNLPYGFINVVNYKYSQMMSLPITHKRDYYHLWEVFKKRQISDVEEVIVVWTKDYENGLLKIFSMFLPKLVVMVCRQNTYMKLTDSVERNKVDGEAGALELLPINKWLPTDKI